jgi:hypothetical protein
VRHKEADQLVCRVGQIGGERVARAPQGHEARAGDARGQAPTVVEREDPILLTVDDQRGRGDLGQVRCSVVSASGGMLAAILARIERMS